MGMWGRDGVGYELVHGGMASEIEMTMGSVS